MVINIAPFATQGSHLCKCLIQHPLLSLVIVLAMKKSNIPTPFTSYSLFAIGCIDCAVMCTMASSILITPSNTVLTIEYIIQLEFKSGCSIARNVLSQKRIWSAWIACIPKAVTQSALALTLEKCSLYS
jgi:hypothetical protein